MPGRPIRPASMRATTRQTGRSGCALPVLVLAMLAVLTSLYYLASQPESLDDIAGLGPPAAAVANLKQRLAIGMSGPEPFTVTEEQINRYIAATSVVRQGGPLASDATLEWVGLRLEDGHFELVFRRKVFGRRHTMAIRYQLEQSGSRSQSSWAMQPCGGRIGRLPIAGQLVRMVEPAAGSLAAAFQPELKIVQFASSARIEKDRLLLGPASRVTN